MAWSTSARKSGGRQSLAAGGGCGAPIGQEGTPPGMGGGGTAADHELGPGWSGRPAGRDGGDARRGRPAGPALLGAGGAAGLRGGTEPATDPGPGFGPALGAGDG